MQLTPTTIRTLAPPAGKDDHIEWDDQCPGFGIRLRSSGSRTWVFQYTLGGGKQRRMSLGVVSAVPIAEARKIAEKLYAQVKLGQDPAGKRAEARLKSAETFEAVTARFLNRQRTRLRPRSYPDVERHLLKHSKVLHGLQLAQVSKRDIATVLAAVEKNSGGTTRNRVRTSLMTFFTWCCREGLLEANPAINTNKAAEAPRDRTLSPEELRLVWTHAGDDQYGAIIKLLALTGARADEIASLRWSEVRGDTLVLPADRVKNKRGHEIFLPAIARALLEAQPRRTNAAGVLRDLVFGQGEGGFSGWSKSKVQLDARITEATGKPLPAWVPHDLRRSFSTHANELGLAPPHIIEACLGHISGFRPGIQRHYNLAQYRNEKRALSERWADQLLAWVEGRDTNVVPLRQA
jgi:integrase